MISWTLRNLELYQPEFLRWVEYRASGVVNVGYLLAFLGLLLIADKLQHVRSDSGLKRRIIWYFRLAAFFCLFNAVFWHPFFNNLYCQLAGLPNLIALFEMLRYVKRHIGIGGDARRE